MIAGAPVGTIVAYGGPLTPRARVTLARLGWLPCTGDEILVAQYPELFQIIGFIYGGDGRARFALPDYRGLFVRGVDGGTGRDPEAGSRLSLAIGAPPPDGVGTLQEDTFQEHEHTYQGPMKGTVGSGGSADTVVLERATDGIVAQLGKPAPRYGSETRPVNVSAHFVIRARGCADPRMSRGLATVLAPLAFIPPSVLDR